MRLMRIFVNDDRHVMAKHSAVYPTQEELEAVQNMVSHTERALKAVSDWIDEQEKVGGEQAEAEAMETAAEEENKEGGDQKAAEQLTRTLRGVMRVGLVAKGLLLKGDLDLELVLLCKDKPTSELLQKVADNLGVQLAAITEDKYEIIQAVGDAAIVIKNTKEPPLTLTIHLTSPVVREEMEKQLAGETLSVTDSPDVLDRQKCLAALASLRHAKWFQARANGLKSCVIVIRVLRDLCTRVPTWAPLRGWVMLLCGSPGSDRCTLGRPPPLPPFEPHLRHRRDVGQPEVMWGGRRSERLRGAGLSAGGERLGLGNATRRPLGAWKDLRKRRRAAVWGEAVQEEGERLKEEGERLKLLWEGTLGAAVGGILHPESGQSAAPQPGAAGAPFPEVPTAVGGP